MGDTYSLPDVTEILDQLGQSKYFSCVDMVMGYHQIEVADKAALKQRLARRKFVRNTSVYPLF